MRRARKAATTAVFSALFLNVAFRISTFFNQVWVQESRQILEHLCAISQFFLRIDKKEGGSYRQ